jgi:hypothetical protein
LLEAYCHLAVAMSGSYRDIKVWQRAIELVVDIYSALVLFPKMKSTGWLAN